MLRGKEAAMQRITPHLWFDTEAVEAVDYYSSALPDSEVTNVTTVLETIEAARASVRGGPSSSR
jgi:predicted 3-demethylubiquinone-9 3-methyltransferase (glyoxalase superfamily)